MMMGAPASQFKNYTTADTFTITDAKVLRRVVVNTGVAAGTVTVTDSASNAIAIIDAANPDIGRQYDVQVNGLIVITSDADLDVTVTYD